MKSVYNVVRKLGMKPHVIGWENAHSPVLAEFVKNAKTVVEVGSFAGKSVIFMAQNAPEGAHPMAAMRQYESQMEELRKKYGGQ